MWIVLQVQLRIAMKAAELRDLQIENRLKMTFDFSCLILTHFKKRIVWTSQLTAQVQEATAMPVYPSLS